MKKLMIVIAFAWVAASPLLVTMARAQESGAAAAAKTEERRLFRKGARLWPVYCAQCHNARPGSEKAPYEWDQIMIHMRQLGNIPPDDANAILAYLKAR
jgi:mono/diheme cytochrome c family protein